jgi:soluble lytic murein transglycosylase-like protein
MAAALVLAGGAWWYLRRQADPAGQGGTLELAELVEQEDGAPLWSEFYDYVAEPLQDAFEGAQTFAEELMARVTPRSLWQPPERAAPYLHPIYSAEAKYGLPTNLLARLIYQESRYRPEIIDGTVRSSAGAVGIAQIVPRWHPGVDATDPAASIDYAAKYLADLKRQFGSWSLALAAYNWGPGNLKAQGIAAAPAETRNYIAQISGDVPLG